MTGLAYGGTGAYGGSNGNLGSAGTRTSPDRTYRIGRIRADSIITPMPDVRIGETMSVELIFKQRSPMPNHRERYHALREWVLRATDDAVKTGHAFDGTPWFSEVHPYESFLAGCEPGRDIDDVPSVWAIVDGMSDETVIPDDETHVTVDLFILAPLDDYARPRAVRRALER